MPLADLPFGPPTPRLHRRLLVASAVVGFAVTLGACASDIGLGDFNVTNKISNIAASASSSLSFQNSRDFSERPITPADLIGRQGQCAGAPIAPGAPGGEGQPNAPFVAQSGIALEMTECEVVQHAGNPDSIEFGNNPRERVVVLTYRGGPRPGIYRFSGGKLNSIERVDEPAAAAPAPVRAQKKSTPAKKRPPA